MFDRGSVATRNVSFVAPKLGVKSEGAYCTRTFIDGSTTRLDSKLLESSDLQHHRRSMKFTSLFLAAAVCSPSRSFREGGFFPKIFVAAADAEIVNHHHSRSHRHASAIADLAGNEAIEAFHKDLHQAARAIEQRKEARAKSLRVLASEEDSEGTCEEELEKCKAARLAPSNLYVQTADKCRLRRREDDTYTLKSTDLGGTTWLFTDKPFKIESSVDTASFVADFDETFPGQPPNFALTAVLPSGQFDEPLVAVMEKVDMADDGDIIKYRIRQSKSQAGNGISLADVVGDVGEGIDLEYCSFFIDATIVASTDNSNSCGGVCNPDSCGGDCPCYCGGGGIDCCGAGFLG